MQIQGQEDLPWIMYFEEIKPKYIMIVFLRRRASLSVGQRLLASRSYIRCRGVGIAKFRRGSACDFFENTTQVSAVWKTCLFCDLFNCEIGVGQQVGSLADSCLYAF